MCPDRLAGLFDKCKEDNVILYWNIEDPGNSLVKPTFLLCFQVPLLWFISRSNDERPDRLKSTIFWFLRRILDFSHFLCQKNWLSFCLQMGSGVCRESMECLYKSSLYRSINCIFFYNKKRIAHKVKQSLFMFRQCEYNPTFTSNTKNT